jgi:ABC-type transport system involved in multi-copper enzyme maturation permease subunit
LFCFALPPHGWFARAFEMFRLIALETRLLWRDVIAVIVLLVIVVAAALAVANGRSLREAQQTGRAVAAAEAAKADTGIAEKLAKPIEPVDAIFLPFRINMGVVAPLPPLIDATAGRARYDPYATTASLRARADTLFKRTQLGNPELLARGSLDLGFVAIIVAPLLLISLGHGVFVADRDSGTARLVLAQAGGPGRLLLARSIPRLALVIAPLLLALACLLLTSPALPGRIAAALSWSLVVILYLALWWAIILLVNSLRISAETAALALVSAWALVSLVLPAVFTAIAQLAYPPPSRFEQIAAARAAEIAATSQWDNDHKQPPEGDAAGAIADLQRGIAIGSTVEAAVDPVSTRFDDRLEQQQDVVSTLSLLSPAQIAADALAASAGTDSASALAFRRSTTAYLQALKAPIIALAKDGSTMTAQAYGALPRYTPQPPRPAPVLAMLYLAGLTVVLGAVAARRFATIKLV